MPEQDANTKRLVIGIAIILVIYAVSVPFFMYIEGLTLVEAIYFVTVSITSAGYGDIVPKTVIGRLYTVFLLLAGVSLFFYHVTHFGQFKERTIDPHVQRRLEVLRNLTALQTGGVKREEIKRIREKIRGKEEPAPADKDERSHGFGKL
jgi:voltage-gated potassium channel